MILDFGLVTNRDDVGYWAGLLGCSYYFGQMCSSFAWGYLADRIGKRPSLILGCIGTLVSCITFAFSVNFPMALTARFLNGALNGNLGIAKAYMGQVSTKETQARAFGYIGLMWGSGSVIGGLCE